MALVKCKECGEQISTKAKSCPKCGASAPKKTSMFTWLVLILFILIMYFSSKTSTSNSSVQKSVSNTSAEAKK